jgi:TonB family protein
MKRVPRLLLVAFALSLLIHLVVAIALRPAAPTQESQAEVVSIEHRPATIAVRPQTPPPPPPKPTPAPRSLASAKPSGKGPGAAGPGGGSRPTAAPTPAATPQPSPAASVSCAQRELPATVVATPAPPDIATDARASATNGTALVSVQLDAGGQVTGTSVTQTSGNSSLDIVAVSMARATRYAPASRDCKPMASAYTFSVKFVAW